MAGTQVKVLLVEDDPDHALFVKLALTDADLTSFELEHVDCLAAAKESLDRKAHDVVLLDLGLPDASGFEALSEVRRCCPGVSVVVLTGNGDPSVGVEAAALGAHDYLYKGDLNARTLERALCYAVRRQQLFLRLEKANELLDRKNAKLAELYETAQQFVDNVSHEFRTPLTVVKEYVTLVRDGLAGQVTQQQRDFLEIANDRTDDLAIMVDDMLDVSKLEAGLLSAWRRQTSMEDILKHVRPAMQRKASIKKVDLDFAVSENLPVVYCDPEKMGRVIINLTANAIKFCGVGGSVTLHARLGSNGSEVVVRVTDDGPGISAENLELIFNRFQQVESAPRSSTKGFGLGLGIAKELVNLNFGEITVESEPGKGSTFSFTVPVWNPTELAKRYLDYLKRLEDCSGSVSLLVANVEPPLKPGVSNAIDEFLQHTFRGNDLVVRCLPEKWLVLARCSDGEIDRMIDCVRTAWTAANRNMPGEKLPEILLCSKGVWSQRSESDEVIRQFIAQQEVVPDERHRPTILLADDDRELVRGLKIRLEAAGYDVITAFDGHEAVESAIRNRPAAILLDNYMPKMDGLEAFERLREHPETMDMPVIILSASLRDQQKALSQGACFFLQKPCDTGTITAALHEVINEPCLAGMT